MTFTSISFLLFCPFVFVLYWMLHKRFRSQNTLLILASYTFYGWWDWRFCGLMLASSLVDYAIGWWIGRTEHQRSRQLLLTISIASNLGLLGFFKYCNFFTESFQQLAASIGWKFDAVTLQLILPVGISFYTFQTLSYTIDVYRRKLTPTTNLIDYLTFVSFFPQLVAGPIERASRLLPQFAKPRQFDASAASHGCRLILWGFLKKVVIADRLAVVVQQYYDHPGEVGGPTLALATVCFAFQIYCDFSAYSDIAIGTAKLFGINLMRNFAYPYFSQSISEFWRRWHISLSTWFRDYVYIPLGGGRGSRRRTLINLMITFLASGLWHGAAWRFVVWGGMNGVGTAASPGRSSLAKDNTPGGEHLVPRPMVFLKMLLTFMFVCVCWVFFRAKSLSDAWLILSSIAHDAFRWESYQTLLQTVDGDSSIEKTLIILGVFLLVEWLQRRKECPLDLGPLPTPVRWAVYSTALWGGLYLSPDMVQQQFIYFTF